MLAFAGWMTFSKFIKLVTHFVRYPVDIFLWPVSILFGWFHGGIKYYALATLSEVSLTPPHHHYPRHYVLVNTSYHRHHPHHRDHPSPPSPPPPPLPPPPPSPPSPPPSPPPPLPPHRHPPQLEFVNQLWSQTTWGSRAGADASDSGRMIKQSKPLSYFDSVDEKLYGNLPLTDHDDMKIYAVYDLKRTQALTA